MRLFAEILSIVPVIVSAVSAVERLFRKDPAKTPAQNNQERQDAAVDLVGDVAPLVTKLVPRAVIDVPKVQAALRAAIDAIVALANAIREALAAVSIADAATSPGGGTT